MVGKAAERKEALGINTGCDNMFSNLLADGPETDASEWRLLLLRSAFPWSIVRIKWINI